KDLLIMNALSRHGVRVSYVPVDTSLALLELACQGAMAAGLPAQGIKADFTRPDHLAALAPDPEAPPRLVLLLGNTLGAFDPLALSAGERLDLNHSYKYDADTFVRILADAGLAVRWRGTSDDARFLMVLAGPA